MRLKLFAAAALIVALPAAARQPTPRPAAPLDDRLSAASEALANLDPERIDSDPAYAAAIADHVVVAQRQAGLDAEMRYEMQGLLLYALAAAERHDASEAAADALIAMRPSSVRSYAGAIAAASAARRQPRLVALVERASQALTDPAERAVFLEIVTPERVAWQLRELRIANDGASRARLAEALLRIGYPGAGQRPAEADGMRMILVRHRLQQSDAPGASAAAADIRSLTPVLSLATDRRYDAVMGDADRLGRVRAAIEAEDRETSARLAEAPDDTDRLVQRAAFLRSIGRDADVLTLLMPLMADPRLVVARGDKGLWLVNEAAYSLIATGVPDEGVELMRPLATMNLQARPDLINTSINFTSILYRTGRTEEALREAERLGAAADGIASDYGKMIIWSTAACSAASLGRRQVSDGWMARMEPKESENRAAMVETRLCRGETDAAERALIAALEDEDWRDMAILWFQDWAPRQRSAVSQAQYERFVQLSRRPAVQAAFARFGHRLSLPMTDAVYGF